jgi:hypothetical protein
MKDKILLSSNLDIIILALFSVSIGFLETFNFLFLFTIIYSPSGVTLTPYILVVYVISISLLNAKAIKINTGNSLGLNLSAYFTLAISLYFVEYA